MSFSETISPFFGRCAFVWFYLTGAMDILNRWAVISAELSAKHVPLPPLVLLIVLLLIVMGSISLLFGYHTRHAAIMLFGMTMAAAVTMHDFWHYSDASAHATQFGAPPCASWLSSLVTDAGRFEPSSPVHSTRSPSA